MNTELDSRLQEFFSSFQPDARRIVHGRGMLYPGMEHLALDWFAPTVLITAYEPYPQAAELAALIQGNDRLQQVRNILLQHRHLKGAPTEALRGELLQSVNVSEDGLLFEVHPGVTQNAGLFLDMRLLRQWLKQQAGGLNVLNLFAYTCSFSVAALAGGASGVTNVDMSKTAIAWGRRNHILNGIDLSRVNFVPHNLFRSWGKIRQSGRYDMIIIDPPTRQRGSFDAEKNYAAVLKQVPKMNAPGAGIIATLNSPFLREAYLQELFRKVLPQAEFMEILPVAPEFADRYPEKGLKICRFKMPA